MRKSNGVWAWCELQQRFTRALQRCRHGAGSNANMAGQWLSNNPSKRWTEVFMLAYSPCWILWALCVFVPLQLYEVGPVATSACLCWAQSCLQILYHERVRSRCGCHATAAPAALLRMGVHAGGTGGRPALHSAASDAGVQGAGRRRGCSLSRHLIAHHALQLCTCACASLSVCPARVTITLMSRSGSLCAAPQADKGKPLHQRYWVKVRPCSCISTAAKVLLTSPQTITNQAHLFSAPVCNSTAAHCACCAALHPSTYPR